MTTGRWVDDVISGMAGRSGQEAKRRRAGRLRKEDRDIDRFLNQLDREAKMNRRQTGMFVNRLLGPKRPPRSGKRRLKR